MSEPSTVTVFPRRAASVMYASGAPDWVMSTRSLYVPSITYTTSPAATWSTAYWMVRQGCARVPGFPSSPVVDT